MPERDEVLLTLRPRGRPRLGWATKAFLALCALWAATALLPPGISPASVGATDRVWSLDERWCVEVTYVDAAGATKLRVIGTSLRPPAGAAAVLLALGALVWWTTRHRVTARHVHTGLPWAKDTLARSGRERVEVARGGAWVTDGPRRLFLGGVQGEDVARLERALAAPVPGSAPVGAASGVDDGRPLVLERPRARAAQAIRGVALAQTIVLAVVLLLPGTAGEVLFGEAWPLRGTGYDLSELGCLLALFLLPYPWQSWVRARFAGCAIEGAEARFTVFQLAGRDDEERHPLARIARLRETPHGLVAEVEGRSAWASLWRPLLIPTSSEDEVAAVVARVEAARAKGTD